MKFSIVNAIAWLVVGLAILLAAACGGGSDSASSGTLQVALTDAVDPNLKEVVISIREIRAVPNGSEVETDGGLPVIASFEPSLVVNVLDLAYMQQALGEALVPAGTYNQVRLILDENSDPDFPANYVTFQDDTLVTLEPEETALKTPGSQTSGLKILGKFTVAPGELTSIVLDLDPAKAVHESSAGKWILKPTGIRIVEVEDVLPQYGALTGLVLSEDVPLADAVVKVVPIDGVDAIAAGLVNPEDGSFRALLPEGTYVFTVEAEGYEPFISAPQAFDVVVGEDTDAGIVDLPGIVEDIELIEIVEEIELIEI